MTRVAQFYYKLLEYGIFSLIRNNEINNYYNNKMNKLYQYNNYQI